ncbi:MAG: hypothetical protein GTO42_02375 [Candidatus Latescibacteria bacterium]|nr:hypothetical protein [Candidatus Latescibacterota bacterium]NIO00982.1 hypothetical protein [Candidatus Latescibacterota bacterium]NIO27381.1 hypothetical protein [Candidatus Latescibacterota bacterium]NIO54903.1 hypothetical protein [Candidatus Latescibacterota bacterium]NIT00992.1 hypothetical protein [Candidatus Latescibacterota bacterium]
MKCAQVEELLPLLAGGELDPDERRRAEAHLSNCPKCQKLAKEYGKLLELSRQVPPLDLPQEFHEQFLREVTDRVKDNGHSTSGRKWIASRRIGFRARYAIVGATAAVAVAALAVFLAISTHHTRFHRGPTIEDYLHRSDFQGLTTALMNERSREMMLRESVSVDLLINTVKHMKRAHTRHGHIAQHLARTLSQLKSELPSMGMAVTGETIYGAAGYSRRTGVGENEVDFDSALHTLRRYRQSSERIPIGTLLLALESHQDA